MRLDKYKSAGFRDTQTLLKDAFLLTRIGMSPKAHYERTGREFDVH